MLINCIIKLIYFVYRSSIHVIFNGKFNQTSRLNLISVFWEDIKFKSLPTKMAVKNSSVILGFVDEQVTSRTQNAIDYTTSKVGGLPVSFISCTLC